MAMGSKQDSVQTLLGRLLDGYNESCATKWLRCKFPSFETGNAKQITLGESKSEKDYFASAKLLGHITRLPEKSGDTTSNRPLVVVAVEMKGDMTERTSRAAQFALAKRVLRDAVNAGAMGLDGLPSQGIFFFYDKNGAFRLSLVTGEVEGRRFKFNEAKRQSFFVRPGASNNIIRRRFHDPIKTFGDLKEAFSVEQLTKEFYRELFKWYEWAKESRACFPNILNAPKDPKKEKQYNHEAIIRLITRLMFTWFIRQRKLVPDDIFSRDGVGGLLKKFDSDSMDEDNYYRAILQNLFFATFNCLPEKRRFIHTFHGKSDERHVATLYRYEKEFKGSDGSAFKTEMKKVPFLNCALFDCLDKREEEEDGGRELYFDGFSGEKGCSAHVPNGLFFGDGEEGHMGIITLFDQYEFTIDENEVNDGDVALDPELLGKVFENLLGAYNPETRATARNATGSFYTPREIVDYMVEESLKNYLRSKLSLDEKDSRLDGLFDKGKAAEKAATGFSHEEEKAILEALYACRIIDPACGSGAFPMGVLNCMVRLLKRLDDDAGTSIREYLLKRYREDKERRDPTETVEDRQERLEELEKRFAEGTMYPNYARKLYLIENCIYGVDIQPIAAQISKLRFFISLLCDQFRTSYNPESDNYGLLSLPNLEAKFVCANTLIALPDSGGEFDLTTGKVGKLRDDLVLNRHKIFGARSTKTKEKYKTRDKEIRRQIREAVRDGLSKPDAGKIAQLERLIEQAKKRRKEVEKPDWVEVEKPVQQELFAATSTQPMLMKIDRNADKRNDIDSEIDKCQRAIAKEQAKGGKENIDAATKYADLVAGWDPFDQNASSPFFDPAWMFNIKDGFDIVIGNPPYGAKVSDKDKEYYRKKYVVSKTISGVQKGSTDTFAVFINCGYNLLIKNGNLAFIVPMSVTSSDAMTGLHKLLDENCQTIKVSSYSNRPKQIFDDACIRTSILFFTKTLTENEHIFTTRLQRRRYQDSIAQIINGLEFVDSRCVRQTGRYAKIGNDVERNILCKCFSTGFNVASYAASTGKPFYYRTSGGRYFNVVADRPTGSTKDKPYYIVTGVSTLVAATLSTTLFWFYQQTFTNGLDIKSIELEHFPLPDFSCVAKAVRDEIISIYREYLSDIERNAIPHGAYKEYKLRESKRLIDMLDDRICPLYGLDKHEVEYIKNYEIGFRLSDAEAEEISGSTSGKRENGIDCGAAGVRALPDGGRAGSRHSRKPQRDDDDDEVLE